MKGFQGLPKPLSIREGLFSFSALLGEITLPLLKD